MTRKKALVLGGKGSIGSAISNHFVDLGHEVTSVGRHEFDLTNDSQIEDFFSTAPAGKKNLKTKYILSYRPYNQTLKPSSMT